MFQLPKCPFCKKKISFLEAFVYKNKPYFKCNYCGNYSHAIFKNNLFVCVVLSAVFLAGTFVLSLFFEEKFLSVTLVIDLLIFLLFYSFCPLMIAFEPSNYVKKKSFGFKKNFTANEVENSIDDLPNLSKKNNDLNSNDNDIFSD